MTRLVPLVLILVAGCSGDLPPPPPVVPADALTIPGIENAFRVTPNLISGGSPEGDDAMAELQKLGVKTILSVDGMTPDLAAAEKAGLKYIHIPIGYDGIPTPIAYKIAKAVQSHPGIVYLHCHHGKHRGPAAIAAARLCLEPDYTPGMARAWMLQAGTDPKYAGLIKLPTMLPRPTAEQLANVPTEFVAKAKVADLTEAMVRVDQHFDALKRAKARDWLGAETPAALLAEDYREAKRSLTGAAHGEQFKMMMEEAEAAANEVGKQVKAANYDAAKVAFEKTNSLCANCHAKYRDR